MSPLREALVLPCLFLTVGLLGGLRIGSDVRLLAPPLVALVLAMLLVGALVRSGTLLPERLMHHQRTPLENLSGLVVLLTLFVASAQVFNLVTPDAGLLHLLVSVFFFVQLLTTMAAVRERLPMLRSLVVLLGSAFVLRFLALESLYSPGGGLMKRVMTAIMEGITLGALEYEPTGAATGYIAFLVLALYLIGLVLLGSSAVVAGTSGLPAARPTSTSVVASSLLLPLLLMIGGCGIEADQKPVGGKGRDVHERITTPAEREAMFAAARVWRAPAVPVSSARVDDNPAGPGSFKQTDDVSCRFVVQAVNGMTPKFYCELPSGQVVKVKYGSGNAELAAEVAGTRLLSALGFGADYMYRVARVRCYGCPIFPFEALICHERTGFANVCFGGRPNYARSVVFEPAVVERRIEGWKVESFDNQGWAWYELDRIDPARGGSTRAEVDAFRLMAVILAHWDNKAENQRLVCTGTPGACASPLALIQDMGATFGPTKLDLASWTRTHVWQDARACRVSMKHLPFAGATFPDTHISEDGRKLLLNLLEQLSAAQLHQLFASSGVTSFDSVMGEARDAGAWTAAFLDKVRQVREGGPCAKAG
jgi:hypothetical protein